MKAVVYRQYGSADVLQLVELPRPTPKADELLIHVHATTVTTADWRIRSLELPRGFGPFARLAFGLTQPRQPVLGNELSGVVEEVGAGVKRFRPGDAVFAATGARMGCHAEYVCLREETAVVHKPGALSFETAAALSFGGTTALSFLRRGKVKKGERVLINGASGAVGSAAVQLAKQLGAHVTGVCSTRNVELVKSLGAAEVVDYTREDFAKLPARYDAVMDVAGTAPYERSKQVLNDGGRLLVVLGTLPQLLLAPWQSMTSKHSVIAGPASERAEDLQALAQWAVSGAYRPVIEHRFPLERIAEAYRVVETGHKRGNVVVTVVHEGSATDVRR